MLVQVDLCYVVIRRRFDGSHFVTEKVAVFDQESLGRLLCRHCRIQDEEPFTLYGIFPCRVKRHGKSWNIRQERKKTPQGVPEGKVFIGEKLFECETYDNDHRRIYRYKLLDIQRAFKAMTLKGVDRRTAWKFAYTAAEW